MNDAWMWTNIYGPIIGAIVGWVFGVGAVLLGTWLASCGR